jgi:flavin-dependent dehydrogenase
MTAVPSASSQAQPSRPQFPLLGHRAVVLGASVGGLLAARVLSQHFFEVVLLERDELPPYAAMRKGTPQAWQPHVVLAKGREVMEALFPGLTRALKAQGAELCDLQQDVAYTAGGQRFAQAIAGEPGLAVSRLALEAELRRRVRALPGVSIRTGVDVVAPVLDGAHSRVEGVRYAFSTGWDGGFDAGEAPRGQTLTADLVVDCTGRTSRLPAWLWHWGFGAVPEDRVEVGLSVVSASFKRQGALAMQLGAAEGGGIGIAAQIGAATPAQPRPSVLIAQEPGADGMPRWVLGVGGYRDDHPKPTLDGIRERCRELGIPELVRVAHEGTPVSDAVHHHFPTSVRRRYERLQRVPDGLLALGDALASINPAHGQGMTVAACQAQALDAALGEGLEGLAKRYFRAAAQVIDAPWQMALAGDLAVAAVPDTRPLRLRLLNAYIARLVGIAPHDAGVARAVLRVVHLLDAPPKLFAPWLAWRVLRGPAAHAPAPPELPAAASAGL